jgi:hypothetical protein
MSGQFTGAWLRAEREKTGFTQQQFADALGTTKKSVWRWEQNGQLPAQCKKLVLEWVKRDREPAREIVHLKRGRPRVQKTVRRRMKGSELFLCCKAADLGVDELTFQMWCNMQHITAEAQNRFHSYTVRKREEKQRAEGWPPVLSDFTRELHKNRG